VTSIVIIGALIAAAVVIAARRSRRSMHGNVEPTFNSQDEDEGDHA